MSEVTTKRENESQRAIVKINYEHDDIQKKLKQFFSTLLCLDGYKENFFRVLTSLGDINILIIGNNDILLNKFISHIRNQCHDVFYFYVTSTNYADFIDVLWNNRLAHVISLTELTN